MAYRRIARFNKKTPTSAKAPYLIFNPHDDQSPLYPSKEYISYLYQNNETGLSKNLIESQTGLWSIKNETFIQTIAIDPGTKNCGIRITRRWSYKGVFPQPGQPPVFKGQIQTVMMVSIDFTNQVFLRDEKTGQEKKTQDDPNTIYYSQVPRYLDKYIDLFSMSQYITIESQLGINYDMIRFGQHLISYIMLKVANKGCRPLVIEIDSHFKTRLLGASGKMDKPARKRWCAEMGKKLVELWQDDSGIEAFKIIKKKDEPGDITCQDEAWWRMLNGGAYPAPLPIFQTPKVIEPPKPMFTIVRNVPDIIVNQGSKVEPIVVGYSKSPEFKVVSSNINNQFTIVQSTPISNIIKPMFTIVK